LKFEFCDFLKNFLKFSKRRRAVLLRPTWTIMVAAKLDQSRVLVTKFHQNRLTLKGRSAGQSHTDKPVGFHGPITPPVPNANSSECPLFGMPAELRLLHAGAARRLLLHASAAVRIQRAHTIRSAEGCRNGKFQNVSPPSVLFESIRIFYNTQETQTQKMMDQNFEIRIL